MSGDMPAPEKRAAATAAGGDAKRSRASGQSPPYNAPSPLYGASPQYVNPQAWQSPVYGRSPRYASGRAPEELGGVLNWPVTQMLQELREEETGIKTNLHIDHAWNVEIVCVDRASTVADCLKKMKDSDKRGLPVVDYKRRGYVLDVIDVFDIFSFIVSSIPEEEVQQLKIPPKDLNWSHPKWVAFKDKGKELFENRTVANVLDTRNAEAAAAAAKEAKEKGASSGDQVAAGMTCSAVLEAPGGSAEKVTILQAIKDAFITKNTGAAVHRCVIVTPEPDRSPMVTLSQTSILRHIKKHIRTVLDESPYASMTLAEMGMLNRKVLPLDPRQSTLYCLRKMKKFGVHSAAIIDPKDLTFIDQVSVKNLRSMVADDFPLLLTPMGEFRSRLSVRHTGTGIRTAHACTVKPDDRITTCIDALLATRSVRAIVVDPGSKKPIAQVSSSNIITALTGGPKRAKSRRAGKSPARAQPTKSPAQPAQPAPAAATATTAPATAPSESNATK